MVHASYFTWKLIDLLEAKKKVQQTLEINQDHMNKVAK
jgi:hypothetical protein